MTSKSNNRVLAIKNKFENLNNEEDNLLNRQRNRIAVKPHLFKQDITLNAHLPNESNGDLPQEQDEKNVQAHSKSTSSNEFLLTPNSSYLYTKADIENVPKQQSLSRQASDPSKKLQRSHAFRCDKNQKVSAAKQHNSFNGKTDTNEYMENIIGKPKLSNDRLQKLTNLLEDRMKRDNFVANNYSNEMPFVSIQDDNVPKHILDQYAKVIKPKKPTSPQTEHKHDPMTDSGVSSETENQEECTEKKSKLKLIKTQFETASKTDCIEKERVDDGKSNKSNLDVMAEDNLCCSSETMRLERKNPHIDLTETLKRALKQPLPLGPPPKKPPRTFQASSPQELNTETQKRRDTKQMLEKLEQVLQKREEMKVSPKSNVEKGRNKEVHYLCTEILGINNHTSLPNTHKNDSKSSCFNSLNCAMVPTKSTLSLPYTRLSAEMASNRNSYINGCRACSADSIDRPIENRHKFSTFFADSPKENCCDKTGQFQSHLNTEASTYMRKEHIYDEPNIDEVDSGIIKSSARNSLQPDVLRSANEFYVVNDDKKKYSTVKANGVQSRSMEDLRNCTAPQLEEIIYDVPCHPSRSPSPDSHIVNSRHNFESVRSNFENGFQNQNDPKRLMSKPVIVAKKPKPLLKGMSDSKIRSAKSIDNLSNEFKSAKSYLEKKFSTEIRKPRKFETQPQHTTSLTIPKRKNQHQLDVDRENLNRLMNEIYETVSAACRMDDQQKPTRFPIDQSDGTSSEDSVKLTHSLTEKRKNYVRRVSSRAGYLEKPQNRFRHQTSVCSYKSDKSENHYATFRSWKSFRQENKMTTRRDSTDSKINLTDSKGNLLSLKDEFAELELDDLSDDLDDKAGCLDIDLPFEPKERGLFDICLLVGLNYMTGETYIKNVFPNQVKVPPHIGNLIFPERLSVEEEGKPVYDLDGSRTQCYSLVLTNEKGERNFGYCRRVLPEGANYCLPLCYCIIGRYRAPGFYYKVLQEIESQHGSSESDLNMLLQQLIEHEFPSPGEELHIKYNTHTSNIRKCFRNSVNLGDILKSKTLQTKSPSSEKLLSSNTIPEFYDIENNNKNVFMNVDTPSSKVLKRPLEPRMDEYNLSVLLDCLGPGLIVKVFGSLLLERKVVFISDSLSQLSSCMEALQSILYPFVWQQPLISTIPAELRKDILEAPLPILAGMLRRPHENTNFVENIQFLEGMLIDLSNSSTKLICCQGDESTILPSVFYKTLKTTLQMESSKTQKDQDEGTRNVMISEAFLRFFVDILSDFWNYFSVGEVKERDMGKDDIVFNRALFTKDAPSKQTGFLEWFTETAMFNHFVENMASCYAKRQTMPAPIDYSSVTGIVDVPLPNFYELFDKRVTHKLSASKKTVKSEKSENASKNNYKSAMNNKIKILRSKLRDLVN